MILGHDPRLEREARRKRRDGKEILVLRNDARGIVHFLADDVAENAALFVLEILLGPFQFFQRLLGDNGQRDHLRVRMLQRRSRRLAVIFEDQNVLESLVALQIDHPVAERPDHVFHPLDGKVGERRAMFRCLDDHLMRAHAVHLVEHAFGRAVQTAFNAQRRKFVGDYAHPPSRRVARRLRPADDGRAVAQHFGRRLVLVARTKRAESALHLDGLAGKICGPLGAIGGDDHPAAGDRIFSKLGH